ncbi:MAG: hypothetical protein EHM42_02275 [Planctomycetaceae bacterium]|nr:MAG: hypothetical protein EHM42_02275 [Planctomycetaceae bacterium]
MCENRASSPEFRATAEKPTKMPRFVVLSHDWPTRHWDLMLENDAVLRTWRLDRAPDLAGPIAIQRLPDHRRAYLDFEGPVSGNRGNVTRVLSGTYEFRVQASERLDIMLSSQLGDWHALMTGVAAVIDDPATLGTGWIEFQSLPPSLEQPRA